MFSDFFIEKVVKIRQTIHTNEPSGEDDHQPSDVTTCLAEFNLVTTDDIVKLVSSSPCKSCTLDPLPTPLVKSAIDLLKPVITAIINRSLIDGIFPESYKEALVTPILKKPSLDQDLLKNYRPVSNLTFISKILEKVVASQLTSYLKNNGLLEPHQSVYRQGHSTETTLLSVQNDITLAVGQKKIVLLTLLDLSAAFDTVSHSILLRILEQCGINGNVLDWLSSYLNYRKQAVRVQSHTSAPASLECGVPQGSVLGPVLFTVYTASLGKLLRSKNVNYHLYADDTQIWIPCEPSDITSAVTRLENCIAAIRSWMNQHQLKLNDDKTEFLIISGSASQASSVSVQIGDHRIVPSSTARNLGVVMNSEATMYAHVSSICKSSYMHIHNISKIKRFLNQSSLERLIHAFITTKLDYCNSLLCGAPLKLINKLQRIQNVAARMLTGTNVREHITPVLQSLHWLPIQQRIKFKILVLVFKAVHHEAPHYLNKLIHQRVQTRQLRSADTLSLSVPFTRSSMVQARAFSVAGPLLWNSLPTDLRLSPTLPVFKSKLKTFLFVQYFNS